MACVIRAQRKRAGSMFNLTPTTARVQLDFALSTSASTTANSMVLSPRSFTTRYQKEHFVAVEGIYKGQFVYCGKKANLVVRNILPLKSIPEGAVICNVEHHIGDRGVFVRASGDYTIVISYNPDGVFARALGFRRPTT